MENFRGTGSAAPKISLSLRLEYLVPTKKKLKVRKKMDANDLSPQWVTSKSYCYCVCGALVS